MIILLTKAMCYFEHFCLGICDSRLQSTDTIYLYFIILNEADSLKIQALFYRGSFSYYLKRNLGFKYNRILIDYFDNEQPYVPVEQSIK